ncbi:MAG: PIN domain-containing protein [Pseudomonadota bacterium]|nr:PIN domain-containing protein [Pseudomonadota bacterium]
MSRVLVDTSVWVDHFRHHNAELIALLALDRVLVHPLIIGEVACGTPPKRQQVLSNLRLLRSVQQASVEEALHFIETERLYGLGCGLVDVLLLASALMTPATRLWTLDRCLGALAQRFDVQHTVPLH